MFQNHKKIIYLLAASIILVATLGSSAFVLYRRIQRESGSVKSAEASIALLEDKENTLANERQGLEAMRPEIDRLNDAFLNDEKFVDFLKLLEAMARQTGVMFQAQNANLPRSSAGKAELNFSVKGDYAAVVKFFMLVDELSYAGVIDQLTFTPAGAKSLGVDVRAHYVIFNFVPQQ